MKRDMDLVRKILFAVESFPQPNQWVPIEIEGHSPEEISYHIKLLSEAGLIEADDLESLSKFEWKARSLTWQGHEFLEAAKDNTRWNKAKRIVAEKVGGLPFEALKQALFELIKTAVTSGL